MIPFVKMNGHGNDFVIIRAENMQSDFTPEGLMHIADRRKGLGFDQLIILSDSSKADVYMKILNADGREAGACGNASRCVGYLLHKDNHQEHITIETRSGIVSVTVKSGEQISMIFSSPHVGFESIGLKVPISQDTFPFVKQMYDPVAVNMGNQHLVFYPDLRDPRSSIEVLGECLNSSHPLFPDGINVEWVEVITENHIKVSVFERGSGLTLSCGTGACASVYAGFLLGIHQGKCKVSLPGGDIFVEVLEDKRLVLEGPVCYVCEGILHIT